MQSLELSPDTWSSRLDEFTAVHEGWLISVDVVGPRIGVRSAIEEMPLLGISLAHGDDGCRIAVSLARSPAEHLTHIVDHVTRILVYRTDEGAEAGLQIDAADGTSTIVRLRVAILPERVDHVLHA